MNFSSAIGFHADAQDAVNSAIFDICTEEDTEWPFLWSKVTTTTVAGQTEYVKAAGLTSIDWDSFSLKNTVAPPNSTHLLCIDYDQYRVFYQDSDVNAQAALQYGRPYYVVRKPDNNFILTSVPEAGFTLSYEGFSLPVALSAYGDVPVIPAEFEQVIIDKAMHYAYMFRDNIEQANLAQDRYEKNCNKMRRILIPQSQYMRFEG